MVYILVVFGCLFLGFAIAVTSFFYTVATTRQYKYFYIKNSLYVSCMYHDVAARDLRKQATDVIRCFNEDVWLKINSELYIDINTQMFLGEADLRCYTIKEIILLAATFSSMVKDDYFLGAKFTNKQIQTIKTGDRHLMEAAGILQEFGNYGLKLANMRIMYRDQICHFIHHLNKIGPKKLIKNFEINFEAFNMMDVPYLSDQC